MKRDELPLMDIDEEGFCSLLATDGTTKTDLKLPEGELGDEIRKAFEGENACARVCVYVSVFAHSSCCHRGRR